MALWRIRATVDDRPGYLSVLTASLALRGVNILAVQVHTTEAGAVDDFLVDAPPELSAADLVAAVERGRGRDCWVAPSGSRGLADQPTRVLGLAARVVREPEALGEALRTLLDATVVTWRPGLAQVGRGGDGGAGFDTDTMWLPDPAGGWYEIVRAAPVFTPAEYARAQALVEVAGTAARQVADRLALALPDGTELLVRPGTADDLAAVREMYRRCSARSRRGRHLAGRGPAGARLARLFDPARGLCLVATTAGADGARVVGIADLVVEGDLAEVALLVEDGWQRRGLGTGLLRRALALAARGGCAAVVAHTRADNAAMLRLLARHAPGCRPERDGPVATVTLPLTRGPAGAPPGGPTGTAALSF